jgi:tRNA pseudouridine38-40 synthase
MQKRKRQRSKVPANYAYFSDSYWARYSANDEVKILSVKRAPDFMDNPYSKQDTAQPPTVDWNARFSATERTYVYRLLCYPSQDGNWGVPFEWDRSWRIRSQSMNYRAMQEAALSLEGTHDFSSFRASKCIRKSPVVTMNSIKVHAQLYGPWNLLGGDQGLWTGQDGLDCSYPIPQLVTIHIVGSSFLYRQVRNMVGCLAQVGTGKIDPGDIKGLLEQKDRRKAPSMAPAHGLFLADVKHGDFHL